MSHRAPPQKTKPSKQPEMIEGPEAFQRFRE
jgi:hypothetical protein